MKVATVIFKSGNSTARYAYLTKDDSVEVGDYGIANDALVSVVRVESIEEYDARIDASMTEGFAGLPYHSKDLKYLPYVVSRKAERELAKKKARITEIKNLIINLKAKADQRKALEETAGDAGKEGLKLLDELDKLEAEIAASE